MKGRDTSVHLVRAGVAGVSLVYPRDSATINLAVKARIVPGPHWEVGLLVASFFHDGGSSSL